MALSSLEKVLAFYVELDHQIEALPHQCMVYPDNVLTSFAIERELLLERKRVSDPAYLMDAEAQQYFCGIHSRADMTNMLKMYPEVQEKNVGHNTIRTLRIT